MVSSIGSVINVYDSMYEELEPNTQEVVCNIFGTVKFNFFVGVQKQKIVAYLPLRFIPAPLNPFLMISGL